MSRSARDYQWTKESQGCLAALPQDGLETATAGPRTVPLRSSIAGGEAQELARPRRIERRAAGGEIQHPHVEPRMPLIMDRAGITITTNLPAMGSLRNLIGAEVRKLAQIPGRWKELLRPRRWRQFFDV